MTKVIVVSGPPAAGKTKLATSLSRILKLPLLAKDDIKESLFDSLGYSDRARSIELGRAAFNIQLQLAKQLVSNEVDFILETAFWKGSASDLTTILANCNVLQVWVTADLDILLHRIKNRPRHPGHADWDGLFEEEFRTKVLSGNYDALDIGGTLIKVESNYFESSQYKDAFEQILAGYRLQNS